MWDILQPLARNHSPFENIKLKLTTKSRIETRLLRTKVKRCKQLKFQRPAPLAAIIILWAGYFGDRHLFLTSLSFVKLWQSNVALSQL